ncbi:polymer-forming cytoskeletal protein [Proteiniborus sp. MB09-C3]|uniref:bactofilin family protein n=1 Tax=Proteiniborus sp. MB09-C3 TaxID=3050072 RepID=UPI00255424B1|nr:polymer-forming cytoskeletal protein [Proteiniborus sp. MB09-C3]WIV12704.1 polymer-forming cytoskeletal protein [Proteiniborus sp. MB09-C3]
MLRRATQGIDTNKTVIDKETKIIGNIAAKDIDILGTIEGNVEATGKATIIGIIKGNVTGADIAVNGKIEGNVISSGLVYADKDAVVTGDIEFGSILVEDGAVLKGTFKASEKGYSGGTNKAGIKIKWGKESESSNEAKLRLKNLMDRLGQ